MLEQLGVGGGDPSPRQQQQQQQQQYESSSPQALPSFLLQKHADVQAQPQNWHSCGHHALACQYHQPVCSHCHQQQQQAQQHVYYPQQQQQQQQTYPCQYDYQMAQWPAGQQFSYPPYPHQLAAGYMYPQPPPTYAYVPTADAMNYRSCS
ncbi:hypothetical protein GGTG_11729 [Gaeumannomyces tritici R3-111a-1]|uniref:Uncharacterized protein n=1 Tax=Gaeumannomyces tritici (strain R3-111a-1) TaxID=644352 RepID=J3PE06_GAET3|nr:hypothetical protein GGTG_11729 [Gaeumannomyces tritici R3-111a-1]EJT70706.1 hypothetical protein GGTG_11729 [Gaeumannomyces tritici R3-111a-1]